MARIVAMPGSGDWFVGGLVAYAAEVKFQVLGVAPGPVVTAEAAKQMASGVRLLLQADIGFATTGVAGPETEEDQPVGTVFIGSDVRGETAASRHHLSGSPDDIRSRRPPLSWPASPMWFRAEAHASTVGPTTVEAYGR